MTAPRVVITDVLANLPSGYSFAFVAFHLQFRFDGPKARLHEGIVVATIRSAHALTHLSPLQNPTVLFAGVLPAAIRMVDQIRTRSSQADGTA